MCQTFKILTSNVEMTLQFKINWFSHFVQNWSLSMVCVEDPPLFIIIVCIEPI